MRELAAQIGARPSALYHHLAMLIEAGWSRRPAPRTVNRKRETLYATPAPRMRLIRALAEGRHQEELDEDRRRLDPPDGARLPRRRQAAGPVRGRRRARYGFFRLLGRPRPKAGAINARLREIAEILWAGDDPAADPVCLAWVMTPLGGPAD